MLLSLLMLGSCSTAPPQAPPEFCEPDIRVETKYVAIDERLTLAHYVPSVPIIGDNAVLLDWAMACAGDARMLNGQVDEIRSLGRE